MKTLENSSMWEKRDGLRQPETKAEGQEARWQTQPVAATSGQHRGNGSPSDKSVVRGWKRMVFLCFAGALFAIGALGAFLPGLPATPFLLLTSYFLVRSSPRLNRALLRSRFFGPILTDWQLHGGVRRDVKVQAIIVVVIAVAVTILLTGYSLPLSVTVILLAAVGITVILRLPTAKRPRSTERS